MAKSKSNTGASPEAEYMTRNGDMPASTMKTQGEIEAAICEGVTRFERDYMGRGPKDIRAFLIGDLLLVRLQGVLTAAEQQLVKSLSNEKGRDLLKQVRTHLTETARPVMEAMVQEITGVKVVSLHHDISTVTGEEILLFTLASSPLIRDVKKSRLSMSNRFGGQAAGNRSRTEIESALCEDMNRFEQEYMGRRPQNVQTHLLGDILLVRLQGVLTAAERELAQASPIDKGVSLLKHMRGILIEANRPTIEAMIEKVAGAQVLSLHHDISTVTGEEVLVLTLVEIPQLT